MAKANEKPIGGGARDLAINLFATATGGSCAPLVAFGWQYYPGGEPPGWATGTLPSLIGVALVLGGFLIWQRVVRPARRRRAAQAAGDRMAIYVADLPGDDADHTARESVIESIRRELGRDVVEVMEAGQSFRLTASVSADRRADAANQEARRLLRQKGGDLLIWGRVHAIDQRSVLELRFVGAETGGGDGQRFGFTQELVLDEKFAPERGAALAAVAASMAAPAVRQRGRAIWRALLPLSDRLTRLIRKTELGLRPSDRGKFLHSHALILTVIGEQSRDIGRLELATISFRLALEEWTEATDLQERATAQNNLAAVLGILGDSENGTEWLEESAKLFREVVLVWTQENVPLKWAGVKNNLGLSLRKLGERDLGTRRLRESVTMFREALKEWTRERAPLDWAIAQDNLGVALRLLGERCNNVAYLMESLRILRAALEVRTRKRVPVYWAETKNHLGNTLKALGKMERNPDFLMEAVAVYECALKVWTRECMPQQWAGVQNNIGLAFMCPLNLLD